MRSVESDRSMVVPTVLSFGFFKVHYNSTSLGQSLFNSAVPGDLNRLLDVGLCAAMIRL
jgi:hypothetical protein